MEEAKKFAEAIIATKLYQVDVGMGQINHEAHLMPKGWSLEEVLSPETALVKVAQVLKERGWANDHSSNPAYAKKWQGLALAALDRALGLGKASPRRSLKTWSLKGQSSLVVFNSLAGSSFQSVKEEPLKVQARQQKLPVLVFMN